MADSKVLLLSIALYLSIVCFISLPFYIYGLVKWSQFQRHFIVSKRFPLVSNMIIFVVLITMIAATIQRWLDYITNTTSSDHYGLVFLRSLEASNGFIMCCLPVYRLLLIYLRWKRCQSVIKEVLNDNKLISTPLPPSVGDTQIDTKHSNQITMDINKTISLSPTKSTPIEHTPTSQIIERGMSEPTLSDTLYIPELDDIYQQNVYKHMASICLSIYIFIGYICILSRKIINISSPVIAMVWISLFLIGIVLITLIKTQRVQEGIGCLREAYVIMICLLFVFIFMIISGEYIIQFVLVTFNAAPGLLSIYIPLYYIKQSEGTLDAEKWRVKFQEEIYQQNSDRSKSPRSTTLQSIASTSIHSATPNNNKNNNDKAIHLQQSYLDTSLPPTPISVSTIIPTTAPLPQVVNTVCDLQIVVQSNDANNNNNNNDIKEEKEEKQSSVVAALQLNCLNFLRTEQNYKALATYLGHCFALENLLFMEKVNILYFIVKRFKETDGIQRRNKRRSTDGEMQRVRFDYLSQIYFEYIDKINKWSMRYNKGNNINDSGSIKFYRKALFKIYKSVFDEYIENGCKQQVNLSAETRDELVAIFNDQDAINYFHSFDDFLYVFDPALIEVYQLVFGIYTYRFKKWCQDQ